MLSSPREDPGCDHSRPKRDSLLTEYEFECECDDERGKEISFLSADVADEIDADRRADGRQEKSARVDGGKIIRDSAVDEISEPEAEKNLTDETREGKGRATAFSVDFKFFHVIRVLVAIGDVLGHAKEIA